jgi:CelD/BcsL family acetyltransferase involved in cellulose biosynthesis
MTLDLLDPRAERDAVAALWQALAADCPHSYFLSWGFIDTWLALLPEDAGIRLAVVRDESGPVAAAFVGHARVIRQRLFRSQAYLLNQTGSRAVDQIYIEDNNFLCRDSAALTLRDFLAQLPGAWEELYLSGVDPRSAAGRMLNGVGDPYQVLIANRIPAPYVDLSGIASGGKDYLASLSSNTRSQIRRCYKLYEARGPLVREVAHDTSSALEIYDDLVKIHQHWWGLRGDKGAFANPWFYNFHRTLIERRFEAGEIQLIRVRCGDSTIGCIYNFVWNGRVSFYQSGFRAEEDNRLKPGFICHTEAIRHNLAGGQSIYDFMASFDEYKLRMSTHQRELVWARVQKPRLKFAVERMMRAGALRAVARYRQAKSGRKRPARAQVAEPAC